MSELPLPAKKHDRSRFIRIAMWLAIFLAAAFLLLVTQSWPGFVLLIWHFMLGWAFHLFRVSANLHWSATTLLLSLAALIAASLILQKLIRSRFPAMPFGTTIRTVAIVLCGAAAAIVTSGIMHQSAWLLQKPVFYTTNRFWQNDERRNTHLVLVSIQEYFARHDHYPARLDDLLKDSQKLKPHHLFYQLDPDADTLQPIIYLRPQTDKGEQASPHTILLVARMQDRICVGRADGSWNYIPFSVLEKECPGLIFPPASSF